MFAKNQSKYFGGEQGNSTPVSKDKHQSLFLNYENFSQIFKPVDKAFYPQSNKNQQINFNNNRGLRESEYYLIRQIILLTFRKIDEIGMIVQYLKEYPSEDIYEFLCTFNNGVYSEKGQKKGRFADNYESDKGNALRESKPNQ
jgi:hypothetical protein